MKFKIFIYLFLIIYFHLLHSKSISIIKKIKLIHADYIQKNNNIDINILFLKGNIQFKHNGIIFLCKNAIFYKKKNKIYAYGNIKIYIKHKNIYSQFIEYNGNTSILKSYENFVFFKKKNIKLSSNIIIYNNTTNFSQFINSVIFLKKNFYLITDIFIYNNDKAYYTTGGIIYNNIGDIFFSKNGIFSFIKNKIQLTIKVCISNKKRTLYSKYINYYIKKQYINFFHSSIIENNENPKIFFYTKNGGFYKEKNFFYTYSFLSKIYNQKIKIIGNNFYFNYITGYFSGINNIWFKKTNTIYFISNQYNFYPKKNISILKSNPIIIKLLNNNKYFVYSDIITILKKYNSIYNIQAYPFARILKNHIECNSNFFIYKEKFNIIEVYKNPIFQIKKNKFTGSIIYYYLNNEEILNLINIIDHSSLINKNYYLNKEKINQIKGKEIIGIIKNKQLKKIFSIKKSELFSYINNNNKKYINIKSICNNIKINFDKNNIQKIFCEKQIYSKLSSKLKILYKKNILSNSFYSKKKHINYIKKIFVPSFIYI